MFEDAKVFSILTSSISLELAKISVLELKFNNS
jgi:hypothetical protein